MSLIPIFTGGGGFLATGGTMYTQGGYRYHKFTSSGTFTVVKGSTTLEYLVVAGGGSGGNPNGFSGNGQYTSSGGGGGGGGAGALGIKNPIAILLKILLSFVTC